MTAPGIFSGSVICPTPFRKKLRALVGTKTGREQTKAILAMIDEEVSRLRALGASADRESFLEFFAFTHDRETIIGIDEAIFMTNEDMRKTVESIHQQILEIPDRVKKMKEKERSIEAEWAKVGRVDYWEDGCRPSDGCLRMALVLREALVREWEAYCKASNGAAWHKPTDGDHKCTRLNGNMVCGECGASYAITIETAFNKLSRFRRSSTIGDSQCEFILVDDPLAIEAKRPPFFEGGSPFYVCVDKASPWVPEFYCAVKKIRGTTPIPVEDKESKPGSAAPSRDDIFNEPTVSGSVGAPSTPFPRSMPLRNEGPLPKKRK